MSVATANSQQPDPGPMNQKKYAIPKENIKKLVLDMGGAFATDQIMVDGKKIGYMYREKPNRPDDSGWRFFSGDEDQSYVDDLSHTAIYAVNTMANYDPDIIPYLNISPPCAFEKIKGTTKYRRVKQ
jgi:hypothetical protein